MLTSMTGFAYQTAEFAWGKATWEIRSLNSRYLELNIKLPESLFMYEPKLRTILQQYAKRGKLEAGLKIELASGKPSGLQLNSGMLEQVAQAYQDFCRKVPVASFDFAQLLSVPEVWLDQAHDSAVGFMDIEELLHQTLLAFQQSRQREGEGIACFLAERLQTVDAQIALAQDLLPHSLNQARTRLLTRLAEIQQTLDANRLEQEMVLLAQKLDIAEELARIAQHSAELKRLLQEGGMIGRRLDFLMQEFNREANTLGSKSADSNLTQVAVELKVLIEQMREQIQNVE
jgi:uncharacterized protein (TIGR00255 family)